MLLLLKWHPKISQGIKTARLQVHSVVMVRGGRRREIIGDPVMFSVCYLPFGKGLLLKCWQVATTPA